MITNFKLFENKNTIFHCYIPYSNKEIFYLALEKIDITNLMKEDIIKYFEDNDIFQNIPKGVFLRFYNEHWDFFEISNQDIKEVIKGLENTDYNSDDMESYFKSEGLPKAKSIYIGKIKLTKNEIEFLKNIKKYNL